LRYVVNGSKACKAVSTDKFGFAGTVSVGPQIQTKQFAKLRTDAVLAGGDDDQLTIADRWFTTPPVKGEKMETSTCIYCNEPIQKSEGAACGWSHIYSHRVMCSPRDATPELSEDDGYKEFWRFQSRRGDPQKNHNIVREGYAAGWRDALERT
jgi:hypothetical protein